MTEGCKTALVGIPLWLTDWAEQHWTPMSNVPSEQAQTLWMRVV